MINWTLIGDLVLIFIPLAIVIAFGIYSYNKTRDEEIHEENSSDHSVVAMYGNWAQARDEANRKHYENLISFWLQRFEENTETLSNLLKVKDFLYNEYESLIYSSRKNKDNVTYFYGSSFKNVIPFIGEDNIFYAICFKEIEEVHTYEISLLPYAKDKFVNKYVKPISYDELYYPMEFIDSNWLIKPCYKDAEVYIPS